MRYSGPGKFSETASPPSKRRTLPSEQTDEAPGRIEQKPVVIEREAPLAESRSSASIPTISWNRHYSMTKKRGAPASRIGLGKNNTGQIPGWRLVLCIARCSDVLMGMNVPVAFVPAAHSATLTSRSRVQLAANCILSTKRPANCSAKTRSRLLSASKGCYSGVCGRGWVPSVLMVTWLRLPP